jgi:hypothetical protein
MFANTKFEFNHLIYSFQELDGVYEDDFPDYPPFVFNYTQEVQITGCTYLRAKEQIN